VEWNSRVLKRSCRCEGSGKSFVRVTGFSDPTEVAQERQVAWTPIVMRDVILNGDERILLRGRHRILPCSSSPFFDTGESRQLNKQNQKKHGDQALWLQHDRGSVTSRLDTIKLNTGPEIRYSIA